LLSKDLHPEPVEGPLDERRSARKYVGDFSIAAELGYVGTVPSVKPFNQPLEISSR
jgi:hypothetical protein